MCTLPPYRLSRLYSGKYVNMHLHIDTSQQSMREGSSKFEREQGGRGRCEGLEGGKGRGRLWCNCLIISKVREIKTSPHSKRDTEWILLRFSERPGAQPSTTALAQGQEIRRPRPAPGRIFCRNIPLIVCTQSETTLNSLKRKENRSASWQETWGSRRQTPILWYKRKSKDRELPGSLSRCPSKCGSAVPLFCFCCCD